ncbi:dethiobiotin synthetase [Roseivirga pacifica]|uniref:ATP-dependent dethiobiotin synthetase BioD n=1 Tax=Roseivirga pacifica TaxID=1267423 RepID=A0A1I0P421_9BACT|nr:dethiobiotin synthetase [Roseivirga pacifica]SEW08780.1 dethiobiotin synthetase [Roseivirga pacifica]
MQYFVTAIGTESGKTLISAILTEALKADYWKPIQAGEPGDTERVQELVSNPITKFHPETHRLKLPASPHAAAKYEHKAIALDDFILPETNNDVIVEGAGGVLVPLNDHDFVIDIAKELNCEVVLVANLYLGSINHTLLTVDYLKRNDIPVKGIIFNGEGNEESERIIEKHSGYKVLLRLPKLSLVNQNIIQYWADELMLNWYA